MADICQSNEDKALYLSSCGEVAGLWLVAGPKPATKMTKKEFLRAGWLRLRLPQKWFPSGHLCACPRVKKGEAKRKVPLGERALHCFTCTKGSGHRIARHDEVCTVYEQLLRDTGSSQVTREPKNMFCEVIKDNGKSNGSRPDIRVKDLEWEDNHFTDVIIDVVVSYAASEHQIRVNHTESVPGASANSAYNIKMKHYNDLYAKAASTTEKRPRIVPVAIEVGGRMHSETEKITRQFIRRACENSPIKRLVLTNYWFKRIAVAVQKSNARLIDERARIANNAAKSKRTSGHDDTLKAVHNDPTM